MDIILLQDLNKVGDKYDIASVKPGFGRNYLIPQGLAIVANSVNRKKLDAFKAKEAGELAQRVDEFKEMAEKMKDIVFKIAAKAGESGKIFGSVTNIQLSQALKEQMGVEISRKHIVIEEDIKELGTYTAQIKLHADVDMKMNFEVYQD